MYDSYTELLTQTIPHLQPFYYGYGSDRVPVVDLALDLFHEAQTLLNAPGFFLLSDECSLKRLVWFLQQTIGFSNPFAGGGYLVAG